MNYIMGVEKHTISYGRLSEIATLLKDGLIEDDEESAIEYLKKTVEITEDEAEYFGVKEMLFTKLYKVVEVEIEETRTTKVQVIVPDDASDSEICDAVDYYDIDNIPDWDWTNDNYQKYVYGTLVREITELDADDYDNAFNYETYKD